MKAVKIRLRNFCQYTDKTFDFAEGLVAILGPNGSGKSNLLNAMRWAVTGDNGNVGVLADNVKYDAIPEDESSVEFTFTHDNHQLKVTRYLQPVSKKSVLRLALGDPIYGDQKVNAKIHEILGVSEATLNSVVLVAQGDLFGFLSDTPTVRAAAFQKLFNTDRAAVVHRALTKHLKTVDVSDVSESLDSARLQLLEVKTRRDELAKGLANMPSIDVIQADLTAQRNVVAQYTQRQSYENQLRDVAAQAETIDKSIMTFSASVDKDTIDRNEYKEKLANAQTSAESAQVTIKLAAEQKQALVARSKAEATKADLTQQLTDCVTPIVPGNLVDVTATEVAVAAMRVTMFSHEQLLKVFDGPGTIACPSCGILSDSADVTDRLGVARTEAPRLREAIQQLQEATQLTRDYNSAMVTFEANRSSLQSQLLGATVQLDQIKDVYTSTATTTDPQDAINWRDQLQATVDQYDKTLETNRATLSSYHGQISQLLQQRTATQKQLAIVASVTLEAYQLAERRVSELQITEADVSHMSGVLSESERTLISVQQTIDQLTETEARNTRLRAWRDSIEEWRGIMHVDGAPRIVAHNNLMFLQTEINHYLSLFGASYQVTADAGLSFTAHFNGGKTQPATRLSGGERVILALAFCLAVNFMFADIGFMLLDEPTAYLDQHHIKGFAPVLARVQEFVESRGLQCVIITHEEQLAHLFNQVIAI